MDYQKVCEIITKIPDVMPRRFKDVQFHKSERCPMDFDPCSFGDDKRTLFLRHDIDHDPFAALEMAKVEASFGIKANYYFLTNDTSIFHYEDPDRREKALTAIAEVEALGHEVALHYDCIGEYLATGKPLAESIEEPLQMLRDFGLSIEGCVAHGASRVRILAGEETFPLHLCNYQTWNETNPDSKTFHANDRDLTLPGLSLDDFGLKYECYFTRKDRYMSDSGGLLWRFWEGQEQPFEQIREVPGGSFNDWIQSPSGDFEVMQMLVHPVWWVKSLGMDEFYYYGTVKDSSHEYTQRVYRTW